MKGDFSRETFDPTKHFSRVLMQQGRVQLDADWNEQNAILLRYLRTLAKDIFGPNAGPADDRDRGFEILFYSKEAEAETKDKIREKIKNAEPDESRQQLLLRALGDQNIVIGPGRHYVEGVLVENERPILYTEQLGIGSENQPPVQEIQNSQKDLLFYLDVWERHISYVEDDSIREVALNGVDTCSRSKVVWKVKVLPGESLSCSSLADDPDVKRRFPMLGGGRLRARARHTQTEDDQLCVISPGSRYRGAENQLYRVEVHRSGKATNDSGAGATFKWSRENGSVKFGIERIAGAEVVLENLGRDEHLGLKSGDWVEFMDDRIAMSTYAGPLAKIETIDRAESTITVALPEETALPSYTDAEIEIMHPYMRRWDHAGKVTELGGALRIAETGSTNGKHENGWTELEDGVEIQFVRDNQAEEAEYRAGDYWLVPARVATGNVEWPDELETDGMPKRDADNNPVPAAVKPHGPRHYYAPLLLYAAGTQQDCRGGLKQETSAAAPMADSRTYNSARKGWLRMPFRPTPILASSDPKAEPPPPPFRIGTIEARAHKELDGKANTKGAGGTMAVSLPPGVKNIHRLRVAGEDNEKEMRITLFRGGWNSAQKKHIGGKEDAANTLVEDKIRGGPYDKTYEINEGDFDAECSTLSIEISSTGYSSVSLVAVELS